MRVDELIRLVITEITSAYTIPTKADEFHRIPMAETWTLCFFPQGEAEYYCEGRRYIANSDSVIMIPEGCSYRYQCTQPGQMYGVGFKTLNSPTDRRLCRLQIEGKGQIVWKFLRILESKHKGESSVECMTQFYTLLKMLLDNK